MHKKFNIYKKDSIKSFHLIKPCILKLTFSVNAYAYMHAAYAHDHAWPATKHPHFSM